MADEVKRLQPTSETLREIYLKSGNKCAFPGCNEVMIDENGTFIGEVCHIEAAMPGGERFNKKQSNEDRRKFDNLMLMCHKHHKITDNVDEYTVDKLRKMKAEHEKKFTNIEGKIKESIKDYSEEDSILLPETLIGMNEYFKWEQTQEELDITIKCIGEFAEILKKIPSESRKIFSIICKRCEEEKIIGQVKFKVPPSEIQKACHISFNDLRENLRILEKYKLCFIDNDFEEGENIYLNSEPYNGWWHDIYEYCKREDIDEMIIKLDFTVLD
ncbi:hypothetical protein ACQPUI_04005 [Clostridium butyricum]|uniref:hypothetical protein n=1 Tax=Clostridium butyricum TaxID=1492 RepID=UPI003D34DA21